MRWRRGTADVSEEITNITFAAFMRTPVDCTRTAWLKILLFMLTGRVLSPSSPLLCQGGTKHQSSKKRGLWSEPGYIMGDLSVCVCVTMWRAVGGRGSWGIGCHELQSVSGAETEGRWGQWEAQEMIKAQVKSLIELSFRLISLLPLLA